MEDYEEMGYAHHNAFIEVIILPEKYKKLYANCFKSINAPNFRGK